MSAKIAFVGAQDQSNGYSAHKPHMKAFLRLQFVKLGAPKNPKKNVEKRQCKRLAAHGVLPRHMSSSMPEDDIWLHAIWKCGSFHPTPSTSAGKSSGSDCNSLQLQS